MHWNATNAGTFHTLGCEDFVRRAIEAPPADRNDDILLLQAVVDQLLGPSRVRLVPHHVEQLLFLATTAWPTVESRLSEPLLRSLTPLIEASKVLSGTPRCTLRLRRWMRATEAHGDHLEGDDLTTWHLARQVLWSSATFWPRVRIQASNTGGDEGVPPDEIGEADLKGCIAAAVGAAAGAAFTGAGIGPAVVIGGMVGALTGSAIAYIELDAQRDALKDRAVVVSDGQAPSDDNDGDDGDDQDDDIDGDDHSDGCLPPGLPDTFA